MARLKVKRSIQWAGVEFQPDLLKPTRPVRLGAILFEIAASSTGIAVIGRIPKLDSRPPEFREIDDVTMALAAKWADSMFKEALEAKGENIFDLLAKRWRWNLYLIQTKALREIQGPLETIAKRTYEKFVGEPFEAPSPKPAAPRLEIPNLKQLPPAWQLEALKQQSLNPAT
jgi:hypothetical protein